MFWNFWLTCTCPNSPTLMIYSGDSVGWPMVRLGCHQSYCTSRDLSVLKFFSKLYISIRTDMWQVPVDAAAKDTVTNHGSTACRKRHVAPQLGWTLYRHHPRSQPPNATKRFELLFAPQQSVGDWSWSVLLIFLAPRAWGNLAAHKEISRVWLLNFLQFCATLARLVDLLASLTRKNILWLFRSRARRCIKSAHSDWLLMNLSWLVYSCCVCSGHDAGLWHFENHNHALTRTHEWTPTPTYSLMYADTHNMNTAYHTHTSFTHTSHTHT